jgi:hypothetical protein
LSAHVVGSSNNNPPKRVKVVLDFSHHHHHFDNDNDNDNDDNCPNDDDYNCPATTTNDYNSSARPGPDSISNSSRNIS